MRPRECSECTNIESHGDGQFVQAAKQKKKKKLDRRKTICAERTRVRERKISSRTKRKVGKAMKESKELETKNQLIDRETLRKAN